MAVCGTTLSRCSYFRPISSTLLSSSNALSLFLFPKRKTHTLRFHSTPMPSISPSLSAPTTDHCTLRFLGVSDYRHVVSGSSKSLGASAVDSLGNLYWLEARPTESGRAVFVKEGLKPGDEPTDITPKEFAVSTVAQEYGGGAFKISGDTVVFSNYKDQRLYKQSIKSKDSVPVPLTPDYGGPLVCYADGEFDVQFDRYVTVMEDCRESSLNATTTIASIELNSDNICEPKILLGDNDFYAFPRMDPKGERIAWIEWGHPNMPWDKSELWVGYIS